ncbi:ribbon-helix-helix protein, CopG family [Candidatus Uhrbacteria bacterium]|nr:ribbon-helix-helix protein, CopG family [Candidatus Uhrbacteria bacterium]
MARQTKILSISLPVGLTKAMDILSKQTEQTRSELVRSALHEYIMDTAEDRERFLEAYKTTREEKTISMEALRKKYDLV